MVRWVFDFYFFAIRIHKWIAYDDDRHFHDHPWWYLTFILSGSYIDISPAGEKLLKRGTLHFFPARHKHTVKIAKSGCWTILLTGREFRQWGFWVKGKFRKRNKYFYEWGQHPCEDI